MPFLIDILIPTYNRSEYLLRNLTYLAERIRSSQLSRTVSVSIADNASTDNTAEVVQGFVTSNRDCTIRFHRQPTNVGLERNALYLLGESDATYVMYLGDDDFIDERYLETVVMTVRRDSDASCVIPGILANLPDGTSWVARPSRRPSIIFGPGVEACATLAPLGHQLSGLVFRRDGLFSSYEARPDLRNIYPFIYFVGESAMVGNSHYLPSLPTRVLDGNTKDWRYDDSGLLSEMLKNFSILFPERTDCRKRCERALIAAHASRLRPQHIVTAVRAVAHLRQTGACGTRQLPFLLAVILKSRLTRHLVNLRDLIKNTMTMILASPPVSSLRARMNSQDKRTFFVLGVEAESVRAVHTMLSFGNSRMIARDPERRKGAAPQKANASSSQQASSARRLLLAIARDTTAGKPPDGYCSVNLSTQTRALQGHLPECCILHLTRHPDSAVRAMMATDLFTHGARVPPERNATLGVLSDNEWRDCTRFEKLCWLWRVENEELLRSGAPTVRWEDTMASYDYFRRSVCAPTETEIPRLDWSLATHALSVRPTQDSETYKPAAKERDALSHICTELSTSLGYSL